MVARPLRCFYAGSAIGSVQGVMQIEALIPAGPMGAVPVVLAVGTATGQTNATIRVK